MVQILILQAPGGGGGGFNPIFILILLAVIVYYLPKSRKKTKQKQSDKLKFIEVIRYCELLRDQYTPPPDCKTLKQREDFYSSKKNVSKKIDNWIANEKSVLIENGTIEEVIGFKQLEIPNSKLGFNSDGNKKSFLQVKISLNETNNYFKEKYDKEFNCYAILHTTEFSEKEISSKIGSRISFQAEFLPGNHEHGLSNVFTRISLMNKLGFPGKELESRRNWLRVDLI